MKGPVKVSELVAANSDLRQIFEHAQNLRHLEFQLFSKLGGPLSENFNRRFIPMARWSWSHVRRFGQLDYGTLCRSFWCGRGQFQNYKRLDRYRSTSGNSTLIRRCPESLEIKRGGAFAFKQQASVA